MTKHTWKLFSLKEWVFTHYMSIFFMTNVYTCFHGNLTCSTYGLEKPSLDDYLDVMGEDGFRGQLEDEYMAATIGP